MEVTRKRLFQKHLLPARPLRRGSRAEAQVQATCEPVTPAAVGESEVTLEQFFRIMELNKVKERIRYSRDVLVRLAGCAAAQKRPACLPEHPIVLSDAREEPRADDLLSDLRSRSPSEAAEC